MSHGGDPAEVLRSLRGWLGTNGLMAYLSMMAVRLIEMRVVLKPTGTLFLHCDPTASHYLKIILDAIFGPSHFGNEIIWQRANAKGLASTRFARNHDTILRYTKSDSWTWNPQYAEHDPDYVERFYRHVEPGTGRLPRMQIATVEDLLAGYMPVLPPLPRAVPGARKVYRKKGDTQRKRCSQAT